MRFIEGEPIKNEFDATIAFPLVLFRFASLTYRLFYYEYFHLWIRRLRGTRAIFAMRPSYWLPCVLHGAYHYLWITPEKRCVSSGRRTRRLRCVGIGASWVAVGWAVLQLHIPPPQAGVGFEVTWPYSFAYKGFHSKRKTAFKDTLHMVL